jgi:hypothetical protein
MHDSADGIGSQADSPDISEPPASTGISCRPRRHSFNVGGLVQTGGVEGEGNVRR